MWENAAAKLSCQLLLTADHVGVVKETNVCLMLINVTLWHEECLSLSHWTGITLRGRRRFNVQPDVFSCREVGLFKVYLFRLSLTEFRLQFLQISTRWQQSPEGEIWTERIENPDQSLQLIETQSDCEVEMRSNQTWWFEHYVKADPCRNM